MMTSAMREHHDNEVSKTNLYEKKLSTWQEPLYIAYPQEFIHPGNLLRDDIGEVTRRSVEAKKEALKEYGEGVSSSDACD